jgi:medium-chain acyl-[acyl-carrier-protein] hydrolase
VATSSHPAADGSGANKWLVCPKPNPAAGSRLFIFPYAGGGPAAFSTWSAARFETWTAHYPGRGSRFNEPPLKDLDSLVEGLAQALQPRLDKPFIFFGHSLGGLIAFELARRLRRHNLPQPKTLFVSACGAPHIRDPHPPIHALPDAEFLDVMKKLDGIPTEILNHPEALRLLLPIVRADFEAVEMYRFDPHPPPLDVPIIAFGGLNDPRVSRERVEGWASLTISAFRSHFFPGDHFFIHTARETIIESITAGL